jgi:hypothetical protein
MLRLPRRNQCFIRTYQYRPVWNFGVNSELRTFGPDCNLQILCANIQMFLAMAQALLARNSFSTTWINIKYNSFKLVSFAIDSGIAASLFSSK